MREHLARRLEINEARVLKELTALRTAGRVGLKRAQWGPRWFLVR